MNNAELLRKTILEVMADLERAEIFKIRYGDCTTKWHFYYDMPMIDFLKLPHNGKSKVL